jgi:two-component system nitrogen regulation response regulator NtrX
MRASRILIVDDEPGVRSALEGILVDEGFYVRAEPSGEEALERLASEPFDAVLLDVWLPGIDGLETLVRLRQRGSDPEVVMISGHGTIETAVRATKLGAFDFIEKPLSLDKTLLVLRNALRQRRLERSNRHLLEQLARDTEILGTSPAAERLRQTARLAADSDAPVLVCGEQGSGRETVVRYIHRAGRRPETPFVEIPCGALDETAAERALFAARAEGGRVERAEGGSLFLEDVDRLAASLQRRLAAALVRDAGRDGAPRVLASAPPDAQGVERELGQYLDVLRVEVPSLRERRDDVPLLAERFLRDLAREYGRAPKQLAPEAASALKSHDWPGNLRELRNVVERLVVSVAGDRITNHDLPSSLGGPADLGVDLYRDYPSLAEGVRAFERYYVARVLAQVEGDEAEATRRLGISRSELRAMAGRD